MGERRHARRYEVYLPLQVCTSRRRPTDLYSAQLRDVSRSGIYFHLSVAVEPGTAMELTFALPTEKEGGASVLVRASGRALRVTEVERDLAPIYGVAAAIDRIDFVRPMIANAAA